MIVDRYYYNQLNKVEKVIYKSFYKGVMEHKDIIPIPVKGNLTQEVFSKIFDSLTRDNPLIYFLNQSTCKFAQDSMGHIAIIPQYFFPQDKIKDYNRRIERAVNQLADQLKLTEGNDYDKALKIHDWICQNVSYDKNGHDINDPARVVMAHNIIGVFAQRRAQCEGIAKAVKVLLNAVDVKCIVATGIATGKRESGPHAWNIVNLDGTAYHMDVTWDIGARQSGTGEIAYDYFNISDELIIKSHKADSKLPECKSMKLNYFTKNKTTFSSKTILLAYVTKMVSSGQKELYFRLEGKLMKSNVVDDIINTASKTLIQLGRKPLSVQRIPNEAIGTYWLKINSQ